MKHALKAERLLQELEDVAGRLFNEVRHEQGLFRTGSCNFKGKDLLVINSLQSIDERIADLAREISRLGVEKIYLKPAVRAEVERFSPASGFSDLS